MMLCMVVLMVRLEGSLSGAISGRRDMGAHLGDGRLAVLKSGRRGHMRLLLLTTTARLTAALRDGR